jgi:hypothetical protein
VVNFVISGGSVPFSLSYIGRTADNTSTLSSYTFSGQNVGAPSATRIIVLGITYVQTTTVTVSTVTVAGNNAVQATGAFGSNTAGDAFTDIWYIADSSNTSANVVVNLSGAALRCTIEIYNVAGTGAAFSAAGNNTTTGGPVVTVSASVTATSGGGTVAVANWHNVSIGTLSGNNLTVDQSAAFGSTSFVASGSNTTAVGSTSFGFTWTTTAVPSALSVATFLP